MPKAKDLMSTHPQYDAISKSLDRWGAFGTRERLIDHAQKAQWLPQGRFEHAEDYATRIALTHNLGISIPVIRRVVGTISKSPVNIEYAGSQSAEALQDFAANVDAKGKSLDRFGKEILRMGLRDGVSLAVILDRMDPNAASADRQGGLYITKWQRRELLDWKEDEHGCCEWVKLYREVSDAQEDPLSPRIESRVWWILTRTEGYIYRQERERDKEGNFKDYDEEQEVPLDRSPWAHNLGIVPVAPFYVEEEGLFQSDSHIADTSLADARKMQFDSDQAMASYTDASPVKILTTTSDIDDVGVGSSSVIKLNPETNESFAYAQLDVAGMTIREQLVTGAVRQGMTLAGIDAGAAAQQSSDGQYSSGTTGSGISLAWAFSRTEQPVLVSIADSYSTWITHVFEIASRYFAPGTMGPDETAFLGSVNLPRDWDLLSLERTSAMILDVWDMMPYEWQADARKWLAANVLGDQDPERIEALKAAVDAMIEQVLPNETENLDNLSGLLSQEEVVKA